MNSRTVLHFVQSLRGGGAEQLVRELVPRLRRLQIDARVLCAYENTGLTEKETAAWNGIVYSQRRTGTSRFDYFKGLSNHLKRLEPKILHTHTPAYSMRAAAFLERVPAIVHTEHRSIESLPLAERLSAKLLNGTINTTVAFSKRAADLIRRRDAARSLAVIPNGVQVRNVPTEDDRMAARTKLGIGDDVVLIGLISNLLPHKNPGLAIESIARLDPSLRGSIRLVMFGEGPLRETLIGRSRSLEIEHLVRFCGFRDDVPELLPGLDIVLSTSDREMMPISLLEAMNAAIPIIGTPHNGTLDLVVDGETGIVLNSWDPGCLAEKIAWAARRPEWRKLAGAAAHQRVASCFDIEAVAEDHATLYHRILAEVGSERPNDAT